MEIDLENMIMSEEQAHLFAVDIYSDAIKYFKELDEYWNITDKFLEELIHKTILSIAGVLAERNNSYQYNLCNYSRIA